MKTSTLLTFVFFVFIAGANAHAGSDKMEKEILRHLNQIQKMGEEQWSSRLNLENARLDRTPQEQQEEPPRQFKSFER